MIFINNLKGYRLEYKNSARKDLVSLDKNVAISIEKKLEGLIKGAPNNDIKRLQGFSIPTYRLRYGDYRVIYEVNKDLILVLVIMVGHRKDVYQRYQES